MLHLTKELGDKMFGNQPIIASLEEITDRMVLCSDKIGLGKDSALVRDQFDNDDVFYHLLDHVRNCFVSNIQAQGSNLLFGHILPTWRYPSRR